MSLTRASYQCDGCGAETEPDYAFENRQLPLTPRGWLTISEGAKETAHYCKRACLADHVTQGAVYKESRDEALQRLIDKQTAEYEAEDDRRAEIAIDSASIADARGE